MPSNPCGDISLISHNDTPIPASEEAEATLISTTNTNTDTDTTNSNTAKKRHRVKSMLSKLAPGNIDYYYNQNSSGETLYRQPKGPIWMNDQILQLLTEATQKTDIYDTDNDEDEDEVDSDSEENYKDEVVAKTNLLMELQTNRMLQDQSLREEEQKYMNERLNANFPMLLKNENVEAVFKASFWRTIPHSGKIYMTDHYFCFNSKILAGQQKLIVPWRDVIQINKIKSRSYYLMYGMSMIAKDIKGEIYFDFSSIELRDHCYSVCQLKTKEKIISDASSIISNDSFVSTSTKSLFLTRPNHISPPSEYDGPPLLSSSSITSSPSLKYKVPERPLHITCLTIGSRGDVQPYLALCNELKKDGHRCRIATHPEYKDWIIQHDIEFKSIGGDPGQLMKVCIDNSFLSVSFIKEGTKFFYSWFETLLESAYEACKGTDVIIESPSAMIGVHMAEKLQIPYFRSMPFPFTRTTKFPHPFAAQSPAGGRIYNDMTYVMIDVALWAGTSKYVNRFRRDVLELPPTNLDRLELWKVPYIYSFSPTVVHPPKDWSDYIHCTGYWFLDNPDLKWKPDPKLVNFLNNSDDKRPIVYIGFGSIIVPNAVETTLTIVESVLEANIRAIICKGWSTRVTTENTNNSISSSSSKKLKHKKSKSVGDAGAIKQANDEQEQDSESLLDQYPGTIYHIDSVPHDWLFPQIQGVVHHGGAGTTAAGLRAGLPTVIKPFFGDQRFWGQRVEELQVGICLNKLTKHYLTEALITITQNKSLISKAQLIGETIRKENGPRNAVECIYRELEFAREQRIRPQ
ncbi:uncharacterized protein BX663DRAFT_500680 [Cokeromyces recurvatus]|uniref:uncharacterized protein n=1 Tax=Cokeromyces recurvatus TaxID=90255 RepID=UPI00221F6B4A|nr:uncharacterized protein BX663DRAFT_500680 [Cokeromyces recurvatus]KAI7905720.1 hypothetical protein BX663DRAFT_500680 [Cokeromyces recurvatus]